MYVVTIDLTELSDYELRDLKALIESSDLPNKSDIISDIDSLEYEIDW